ncbi:MAG: hypothetical protein Ct9H300mP8_01030 [Gammaproteobacteria bacterium]|nr:MAG: hypothetical protein Ct9H300mP8_01030 [Gammaproteobacteria bacterium]
MREALPQSKPLLRCFEGKSKKRWGRFVCEIQIDPRLFHAPKFLPKCGVAREKYG